MKKMLLSICLVLLIASSALAIPYPYGDYDLPTTGDLEKVYKEIKGEYTTFLRTEDDPYPWFMFGTATFYAPIVLDARVNQLADYQFWTANEKRKNRADLFKIVDKYITIMLELVSDPDVSKGYRYVDVEHKDTAISRVILETSEGQRYLAEILSGGDAEPINEAWAGWYCSNTVFFPRFDNGEEIITPDTKWMKIWVIAGTNRIFFQFDFD